MARQSLRASRTASGFPAPLRKLTISPCLQATSPEHQCSQQLFDLVRSPPGGHEPPGVFIREPHGSAPRLGSGRLGASPRPTFVGRSRLRSAKAEGRGRESRVTTRQGHCPNAIEERGIGPGTVLGNDKQRLGLDYTPAVLYLLIKFNVLYKNEERQIDDPHCCK